ncbi:DNA topoisomerase I [Polymorphobacter multimanifer]|uniref:DNA topoisomerase n=1 Tax=Polymorphobacter multimanifer TaxID=1070431 RepID=A0A841L9X8_9SPHN|nr:DNA topoisomerase IB [Polymorphobacter multimanifer]MBB6226645.1 DNA topoisomerase-1 [Polymorphobacter multimanifer]GGI69173.1 DNA topoisomerase I [Polymorphobacter multimanifer]
MAFATPPSDNAAAAREAGLHYSTDEEPGIARIGKPGRFRYTNPDGSKLADTSTLARITALVLPPAWQQVWICPDPRGHIQATGRDARGRKQYRYHADWHAHQTVAKFAQMAAFGRALPAIRAAVDHDLARRNLSRELVLATIVRLLETTLIRIGNEDYARTNKSFGLTTLRSRHLKKDGAALLFDFRGKSGVRHRTRITDRRARTVIKRLRELPGQRLFRYEDEDGTPHAIGSGDVNDYLRQISGADITAKDFRTWAATLAAARTLAVADPPLSDTAAKRAIAACVKTTATALGNTPAVCRAAYIHPQVFEGWRAGALHGSFEGALEADEKALIDFLDSVA